MRECWKAVVGFEGYYEVSSLGRVRSLDRPLMRGGRWGNLIPYIKKGRILKPGLNKGYPQVNLCVDGCGYQRAVHLLVLTAFEGPCPKGHQAAHDNGTPGDPRLANLEWKTVQENNLDKLRHGTMRRGVTHHNARLVPAAVRDIRRRCAAGEYQHTVAERHNVSTGHVSDIVRQKKWAHVR